MRGFTSGRLPLIASGVFSTLLCMPTLQAQEASFHDKDLQELAKPELQTFANDGEFRRYLREVRQIRRNRIAELAPEKTHDSIVVAALQDDGSQEDVCANPEDCPEDDGGNIIVTGSRVVSRQLSVATPVAVVNGANITNVQSLGVDEGDIVKMIGDHLVVLQDGRLFSANYKTMRLTDRIDIYRKDEDGDPIGADWYDEILVQDDQVIVAAYSYEDEATELTIIRLDQATGRMERRGVFLITSDDYYDTDNYATRIVGDKLIIYTPYEPEVFARRTRAPVIRKWEPSDEFDEYKDDGKRIMDASNIHWPVFAVEDPTIHTVSSCPLGGASDGRLQCESVAFVGGDYSEMFVSSNAIYLYTSAANSDDFWRSAECDGDYPVKAPDGSVAPGAVFRLPHRGSGGPAVLGVRGMPFDQFSFDDFDGRFKMLANNRRTDCDNSDEPPVLTLLDEPTRAFGPIYSDAPDSRFVSLPSPTTHRVENRFVDTWLMYGSRDSWSGRPPRGYEGPKDGAVFAVPLSDPSATTKVQLGHQVTRLDRIGMNAIVTGYRDQRGLNLATIWLGDDRSARIAGRAFLEQRFESEGRSHAFNSAIQLDGSGMMGLPTVERRRDARRWWWWSGRSDISFLSVDSDGALTSHGALTGKDEDEGEPGDHYSCEVSCIDWYGNARPFFIAGRIFGLMGTDLVEGHLEQGQIAVSKRIDLTLPPPPR